MKGFLRFLSYLLVAVVAGTLTFMFSAAHFLTLGTTGSSLSGSKLTRLESVIKERFIGEVDETAIEDAAADAMVNALGDRWSYYIPASEMMSYNAQMSNSYVGIGVTISVQEDGTFLVQQVVAGGPAEAAGILPGDLFTGVDGTDCAGLSLSEVSAMVRGEENTDVVITVLRDGQTVDLTVTRAYFETAVATARMLDGNIGLIRIVNFDSRCARETIAAIEDMIDQGATALIFDVRFNPGGYQSELVEVLDYLLPEGPLFRSVDYRGRESVDESDADCIELPMAVLLNGDSYSAAEFFGAALSEYGVAVTVGEKTCGKGYFQTTIDLGDGSAVGLSVGKYFTPNGVSLADVGITPDVEVPVDEETAAKIYAGILAPEDDPQLQAAIQALSK